MNSSPIISLAQAFLGKGSAIMSFCSLADSTKPIPSLITRSSPSQTIKSQYHDQHVLPARKLPQDILTALEQRRTTVNSLSSLFVQKSDSCLGTFMEQ